MQTKLIEIRDEATCVAALAIKTVPHENEAETWLWHRFGYAGHWDRGEGIILARIDGSANHELIYDAGDWSDSPTMRAAHEWLEKNFSEIENGAVVDVRYILGKAPAPCASDRLYEVLR